MIIKNSMLNNTSEGGHLNNRVYIKEYKIELLHNITFLPTKKKTKTLKTFKIF